MALWFVLAVQTLFAAGAFAPNVSPMVRDALAEEARHRGWWAALGCGGALAVYALAGGWVWWAVESGDWRYAGVGLVPVALTLARGALQAAPAVKASREGRARRARAAELQAGVDAAPLDITERWNEVPERAKTAIRYVAPDLAQQLDRASVRLGALTMVQLDPDGRVRS